MVFEGKVDFGFAVMEQAIKCLAPMGTVASLGIAPVAETVSVNIWDHILNGRRYVRSLPPRSPPLRLNPSPLAKTGRSPRG